MFIPEPRPLMVEANFSGFHEKASVLGEVMMWRRVIQLRGLVEALIARVQVLEKFQKDLLLENAQLKVQYENIGVDFKRIRKQWKMVWKM